MINAAIIVAAGRGTRAGGDLPKQWQPLLGRRVIDWTIAAFRAVTEVDHIVVVLHPEDLGQLDTDELLVTVPGGATRALSVLAGLEALSNRLGRAEIGDVAVMIHDAARCCTKPVYLSYLLYQINQGLTTALAPAIPVTDALWTGANGVVTGTRDRTGLYRAQTPQVFDFASILDAHRRFDGDAADDVEIARAAGIDVTIVDGDENNLKITHAEDFARAEKVLQEQMDIRIGTGFDVHRFGLGDNLSLCGVNIPHWRGLQGHSDADVGMHALTDAIYGALAEGDIGRHFPPSDPQWKGAESQIFLRHAVDLAGSKGFRINNMDVTLICEAPRVGPHADAMRAALGNITGVAVDRISVKATTSERLGFTGREEGIAAQAAVTLVPA